MPRSSPYCWAGGRGRRWAHGGQRVAGRLQTVHRAIDAREGLPRSPRTMRVPGMPRQQGSASMPVDASTSKRRQRSARELPAGIAPQGHPQDELQATPAEAQRRLQATYAGAPVSIWQEDWSEIVATLRGLRGRGIFDARSHFSEHPESLQQLMTSLRVLDVNPLTLEMFQAGSKDELASRLPVVMDTPDVRREFIAVLQALIDGHSEVRGEMTVKTARGEPLHVLYSMSLPAPGSENSFLVFCAIDIGERHVADAELRRLNTELQRQVAEQAVTLRQRERDLKSILDNMPSLISYWGADLRNRFGNQAYREWFGLDPQCLPGMHIREVLGDFHYPATEPHLQAVLAGQEQTFERAMTQPDGSVRHAQVHYQPDRGEDGSVQGFYALVTDITPLKQAKAAAEEALAFNEAVIEQSPMGMAVYRRDGECVLANNTLAAIIGGEPEKVRHQNFRKLRSWRESGLLLDAEATLADGLPRRREAHAITSFGRDLWLDCAFAAVDRNGERHLLLSANDVSARHRDQAAIAKARDAAEAAATAKSAFLANMSHEIRTPMNAIVGLSRVALEGELTPRAREYLDKVHGAALALMGILDDVLDYSKIEAGQLRFEAIEFSVDELLGRVGDLFAARIEQKGLELLFEVAPEVPARLVGDPLRLSQVLGNLVGNAVKFTASGVIHLAVTLLNEEPEAGEHGGWHLRLSVRDTGVGIAAAQQPLLFDAFTQADSSITRRFGGSGLGLAICKRLVQGLGGEIGVHSQPGRGSEFHFTAKLGRAPAGSEPQVQRLGGLRVLVIDDSVLSSELMARQLTGRDVAAIVVADGRTAQEELDRARRNGRPYEAILLEAKGDGTAAIDLLCELREREAASGHPRTPLVMLVTSAARDVVAALPAEVAPEAVLVKPLLMPPLLDALQSVRGNRAPAEPVTATQSRAWLERALPLRGARLLLAEDNAVNQIVATEFLGRLGITVVVVPDGVDAVEVMRTAEPGRFDAVLMDLHMPLMDGFEATRRIHGMGHLAELPVIAMSAAALEEDRQRCFDAGMVDHISKPVIPERLVDVLLKWVRPRAAEQDRQPAPDGMPGFDYQGLLARVIGNETVAQAVLGKFAEDEAGTGEALAQLIAGGHAAQARACVHQLKGVAANVGAVRVAEACLNLETVLKQGEPTQAALQALCTALDDAMRVIAGRVGAGVAHAP
ncbi:MAG: response regulator [Aquabacterium sp.]|nr:MAG: response regulator [Aquabacterium sp.]